MKLLQGDCLEQMKTLEDNSVDAIVSDPPYGISFMSKKWDYDVPSVEVWKEAMRVLKPGGHALIACGTRTQHRMVVNIEDAGFEVRDVVSWIYGSGFPKSLNISKAIDKAAGAEREVVGVSSNSRDRSKHVVHAMNEIPNKPIDITAPATEAAKQWDGWGTAIKPSTEYFTLAQKPLDSGSDLCIVEEINQILLCLLQSYATTVKNHSASSQSELNAAASIAQWIADENTNTSGGLCGRMDTLQLKSTGTTSLNIVLSCLSTLAEIYALTSTFTTSMKSSLTTELKILQSVEWENIFQDSIQASETQASGLPASALDVVNLLSGVQVKLNYIRTHSAQDSVSSVQLDPKVSIEFFTLCRKPLSEKTIAANVLKWGTGGINIDACRVEALDGQDRSRDNSKCKGKDSFFDGKKRVNQVIPEGVGRFPANLIHSGEPEVLELFPESKSVAGKKILSTSNIYGGNSLLSSKTKGTDEISGYTDSGSAARFFYCAKASKKDRDEGNNHPTVKPTALMAYLCRLITPTGGTVLDPYMGSGSTGKAALKEGFDFIGCELDPDYFNIAETRINNEIK